MENSRTLLACALTLCSALLIACSDGSDRPIQTLYQQFYSPLDSSIEVRSLQSDNGSTRYFIDEGDPNGIPVLLVTGSGTSVTAALLTTHLNTLRDQLGIRIISVQRNGFGQSEYQPDWGYQGYVADVEAVLESLGVDDFHVFAISGGGPYTAFLAEALGDRMLSLHLAATITGNNSIDGESTLSGTLGTLCTIASTASDPVDTVRGLVATYALNSSEQWWGFAQNNPMLALEGFEAAAAIDWDYTFFSNSSDTVLTAIASELHRYCTVSLPDLSGVTAPLFIYHGEADTSASLLNVDVWRAAFVNAFSTKIRLYPDEGHWVQYSHLEQIYTDIAQPGNLVICSPESGMQIVSEQNGQALLSNGAGTLGACIATAP